MRKPYYKNKLTGNYGVLEGQVFSNHSSYLQLRLVNAVGGMIELSRQHENVTTENLVQVSPEEVEKALLGFMSNLQEIERAISQLSAEELADFRVWFDAFDAEVWDRQFEEDVAAGRLDNLAQRALQHLREGRCTDL